MIYLNPEKSYNAEASLVQFFKQGNGSTETE